MSHETVPGMADAIERRRLALGLGKGQLAQKAGLSREGLAPFLKGYRRAYNDASIIGLSRALRWGVDWYERMQRAELPTENDDINPDLEERLTRLEEDVERILRLLRSIQGTSEDDPEGSRGSA